MADGILGLAGGGASSLNQELIDKLKAAEKKARVEPIEKKLEDWDKEFETVTKIEEKFNALYNIIENFDFYSSKDTYFDQKSASISGDNNVLFDAVDAGKLDLGNTVVKINTLAQKDVHQSNTFNGATKDANINFASDLQITIGGTTHTFDTTGTTKTYEDLAKEINAKEGLTATIDQVGEDSYRLVIKSTSEGTSNNITFNNDPGFGITEIQDAKDLDATVDGIAYNNSSNEITVHGGALKITATATGTSTLNVQNDTNAVVNAVTELVTKYNEFNKEVSDGVYKSEDSKLSDTNTIKTIQNLIKEKLTGTYGQNNDKFMLDFGLEFQRDGSITLDSTKLNDAVATKYDDVKAFFTGDQNYRGMGTQLKEVMFDMTITGGLLNEFGDALAEKKTSLETEKEEATKKLDDKYKAMTARFGQYSAIIARMEASFGGLKMMIQQSTAQN